MKNTPNVVIVGQATIDDIFRESDSRSFKNIPGGDSIYSTIGASVWPVEIGVVTIIGDDYPLEKLENATCRKARTDWSSVITHDGPSIHDKAIYYADGRREYEFNDPALIFGLSPDSSDIPEYMHNCGYVHIAPARTREQLDVMQFYKSRGAFISLDVESHFIKQDLQSLNRSLVLDPIFIPSIEHVQILSDTNSKYISDHWDWIKSCGVTTMIIKCGSEGAFIVNGSKGEYRHIGVVNDLEIDDVTGAGDAFCGGFIAGMYLTNDIFRSSAYGTVSSSFVVESIGAIKPGTYNEEEAKTRLARLIAENNGNAEKIKP